MRIGSKAVTKKTRIIIVGLVVGIAVIIAIRHQMHANDINNDNEVNLYGNIDIREVRVAFNGSEHVSAMLVQEGDRVAAGQLLARLQTERLQAALARAQADVAAAKAEAHSAQLNFQRIKETPFQNNTGLRSINGGRVLSKNSLLG